MRRRRSRGIRRCSIGTPICSTTACDRRRLELGGCSARCPPTISAGSMPRDIPPNEPAGKRIRPALTLWACESLGRRPGLGAAGGGCGRADPQLHPDPRRHPGWRPTPPPSTRGVDDLGRRAGHQRGRRHVRQRAERPACARDRALGGRMRAAHLLSGRGGPGRGGPVPRPLPGGSRRAPPRRPTCGWSR